MKTRSIAQAAAIAALYVLLTVCFAPISSGLMQCRVSEALCVLPYFTASAIPGLFVGCALANLLTGATPLDVVFGSLATLLAALITYGLRNRASKFLSPLPSVVLNALIVGALLVFAYGVNVPYALACFYVAAGQAVACYGLGLPLLLVLKRYAGRLFA